MKNTEDGLSMREWVHKLVNEVDEVYMKTLLWTVQSVVTATEENKRRNAHEEKQAADDPA